MSQAESFSDATALNLETGEFLNYIDLQLRASNSLTDGGPDGLIASLKYDRAGENVVDIAPYKAGADLPQDLDVRATYARKRAMARKKPGEFEPGRVHILSEYNDRYLGSTGKHSLKGLARLTVGMTLLAADQANSEMSLTVVGHTEKPLLHDDQSSGGVWTFQQFDQYIDGTPSRLVQPKAQSDIASGLEKLAEEDIDPETDAVLLVSDFTTGNTSDDINTPSFDWELPLNNLSQELGDRLYAVQLTNPAQIILPYARHYKRADGKVVARDLADHQAVAAEYQAAGLAKAQRIAKCLRDIRNIRMYSQDPTPFVTAADFIFGKPEWS